MTQFGPVIGEHETSGAQGTSWNSILRWAARAGVAEAILVIVYVERAPVPPAILVAALLLVGLGLLARSRRSGVWVTTVASVLLVVAGLVISGPVLGVPASFGSFAVNWMAAITGIVGVVAGVASWRDRQAGAASRRVVWGAAALATLIVGIGVIASLRFTDARVAAGDVVVTAHGSKFHPSTLTVSRGPVTFFFDNADNTLHDFHVIGVKDVDKDLPANHQVSLTVDLAPGTYRYRCDLHSNMTGTLTVR
jgi:plastocyanin